MEEAKVIQDHRKYIVKGYTNLGWTTEKGETEPEYSAGDTVKITKATRFYAVRRKSCLLYTSTLRNNITTDEHPLGVYHPHAEYHHIKKENIGPVSYTHLRGPVYATDATSHLCDIMLRDSAHLQMFEAEWRNRKGRRQGKP